MRRFRPQLPSPAMLVALLALFVALGGSAIAINKAKAPKNSVVTKSIKNGAVTAAKVGPAAIGASQLQDGAVTSTKIAPAAVGAGQIQDGAVSAAKINVPSLNIPAPLTFTVRTVSKDFNIPKGNSAQLLSPCLPGEQLVGGGARSSNAQVAFTESFPSAGGAGPDTWFARAVNLSGADLTGTQIQSSAICAKR